MLNLKKPAFLFSLIGLILFFVGLSMLAENPSTGTTLMYIGLGMGVIFWIWTVIDVLTTDDLKPFQKKFWLIIVLIIPVFGAALYYLMHQSRKKIVT